MAAGEDPTRSAREREELARLLMIEPVHEAMVRRLAHVVGLLRRDRGEVYGSFEDAAAEAGLDEPQKAAMRKWLDEWAMPVLGPLEDADESE